MIAPVEDDITSGNAYAIGEMFCHDGKLYQAIAAIAVGDYFTEGTNCDEVTVVGSVPHDVQIDGASVVTDGVANIPKASSSALGAISIGNGIAIASNGKVSVEGANRNNTDIKNGNINNRSITPYNQDMSVFFGLSKVAGVDLANEQVTLGTYPTTSKSAIKSMLGVAVDDVQINGTSIVSNGVANIPRASNTTLGTVKISTNYGLYRNDDDQLYIISPTDNEVKVGTALYRPISPSKQHQSAFYGLAKAAGDSTQSSSSNAVGTYTPEAKAAIQTMLGVESVNFVETVSGPTPSITCQPNVRYICGEVTSISITPPANGTTSVRFTSGSTPVVLTVPNTVKFPVWFDSTSLEEDTVYEIMITDGVFGGVMTWQ